MLAQSHFLKMEVKFTSRSAAAAAAVSSNEQRGRDTVPTAKGSALSLRPSLLPPVSPCMRDVILGRRREILLLLRHRREPRLVEGLKEEEGSDGEKTKRGREQLFRRGIITPLMTEGGSKSKREAEGGKLGKFSPVFRERSLRQIGVPWRGLQRVAHFPPVRPQIARR